MCALSALLLLKNRNILRFLLYIAKFLPESVGSMSNSPVLWEAESDGEAHAGNLEFPEVIVGVLLGPVLVERWRQKLGRDGM